MIASGVPLVFDLLRHCPQLEASFRSVRLRAPALSISPPLQINERSKINARARPFHRDVGVDLQIPLGRARSGRLISPAMLRGTRSLTFKNQAPLPNNNPPVRSFQP